MTPADWRSSSEDAEYAFMLFHADNTQTQYQQPAQAAAAQYAHAPNMHPSLCGGANQALSDEEILDEIFQEIMSPGPQDQELPATDMTGMASSPALFSPVLTPTSALTASAPSTPQLTSTLRRGSIPSASLGSISPNMAAALRVPAFPMGHTATGSARNTAFFPMLPEPKARVGAGLGAFGVHHSSMLFTSPTAASRRAYRRTNRPSRLQKKKPASRICRMPGCTKGIRSRGLCKAHGGGRRCTTPGCEISDQGGGHCIAHGGGRRCSVTGCQKSAQSKGLCKLHGGARLCRLPDCNKNGQIKGLCRLHYSLTMAAKSSAASKAATAVPSPMPMAMKLEPPANCGPCDFELRV
ncbi:hypothetical protein PHYSODRAFT_310764 [Phytophthora sojae]|uniref:WRKY19-like zinc finger domain-containing protein n=1 Tax=Phytophthora sojae (strain P6497) TaxID=1094619 RepID=G4Z104_PHYSP|nr:hypothetical protein PHYSODRAFT_310764 [Phytophthora sojae]EGZ23429.1 hypothetical protein PHYSODRAFT_310764 [Phytophthora sojae]|eukprot:XP_009518717.1 hypothetical protein PHYSODRAFT_310764 [Phytophthora sojae]